LSSVIDELGFLLTVCPPGTLVLASLVALELNASETDTLT
jgi:hypothetical protein